MAKKVISLSLDENVVDAVDKVVDEVPGMTRSVYANIVLGGAAGVFDANEVLANFFAAAGLGEQLSKTAMSMVASEISNELEK